MSGFDDLVVEAMPYLAVESISATQGSSWEWSYNCYDATGTVVDFTGCTGTCELRSTPADAVAIAPTVTFPGSGQVKVAATPAATTAVPPGQYMHEIVLVNGSGRKLRLVGGSDSKFVVKAKVTP